MNYPETLRRISKNWPILVSLYTENESMNVSAVATKARLNKSIVSRGFRELVDPEIGLVDIKTEVRKTGGRELKKANLTETGRKIMEAILSITEKPKSGDAEVSDPPVDEVNFLIKQTKSQSKEAQDAAWREIHRLAGRTKLWKNKEVWNLMDSLFSVSDPGERFGDAYYLIARIVHLSAEDPRSKDAVLERIWNTFSQRFMTVIESTSGLLNSRRWEIMNLLDLFLKPEEKFQLLWGLWEKGSERINDEKEYEDFKGPYYEHFGKASAELKNSKKKRLYELMNANDFKVRKRASDMHHFLFT